MRNIFTKKKLDKRQENLVIYNAERIIKIMHQMEDNFKKGYKWDLQGDYDTIAHIIKFLDREMERNYNPKATSDCPICQQRFSGFRCNKMMDTHFEKDHPIEYKAHKEVLQVTFVAISLAISGQIIDSLLSAKEVNNEP